MAFGTSPEVESYLYFFHQTSAKEVTKLKEKFHDLFFLKQIVYLHLKDSCLSSKKRIKGPEMSKVWENRQCYVLSLLRLHPHSLCPSTLLNWPAPLHAYAEKHIGFSASLGFLFQRFPCHIEFIFTKLFCYFLCHAVKFLLKRAFLLGKR